MPINQPREVKIPVVIPGAVGEPAIFRALTGNPELQVKKINLQGYALGFQPLENAQPDYVIGIMEKNWAGQNYPGAMTFVPKEGQSAPGHLAYLTPVEWLTFNKRSGFWNFHAEYGDKTKPVEEREKPKDGWYKPDTIPASACPEEGVRVFLTETLSNQKGLTLLEDPYAYVESDEYKVFVDTMTKQVESETSWPEPELDFKKKRLEAAIYNRGIERG